MVHMLAQQYQHGVLLSISVRNRICCGNVTIIKIIQNVPPKDRKENKNRKQKQNYQSLRDVA